MLQKETKEREFLRKEMRPDMYIEKILFTKFYRNKQKALDEIGFEKQCAKEKTANQRCLLKVRALGLDYSLTKWLEKQSKVIAICNTVAQSAYDGFELKIEDVETAWRFFQDLKGQLDTYKTNKRLRRMIEE